jgi:transcriptional regulator
MYIPKYYQMHDYEEIKQFMRNNNFVTVITTDGVRANSNTFTSEY